MESSPHLDVRVTLHDTDVDLAERDLHHLEEDLRIVAAARLYASGQLSIGKASELCGLTVASFLETLAEWHIPVIQFPAEQLQHDLTDW